MSPARSAGHSGMTTTGEGVLMASADPEGLRDFYSEVLGLPPDRDGFFACGPGALVGGAAALHVRVDDMAAAAARADAIGARWVSPVRARRGGTLLCATLVDPDGNRVQLVQATPDRFEPAQRLAA